MKVLVLGVVMCLVAVVGITQSVLAVIDLGPVYKTSCTIKMNGTCSYKQTCTVKTNGSCVFGGTCTDKLQTQPPPPIWIPTCQSQIDDGQILCMICDDMHQTYLNATTIPFNGTYYIK